MNERLIINPNDLNNRFGNDEFIFMPAIEEEIPKLDIKFKKLNPDAIIPSFKSDWAGGFDFHSCQDALIEFGKITIIDTGLSMEMPSPDETFPYTLEMQISPRSGLAMNYGITIVNSPGKVDADYRGPLKIIMTKVTEGTFKINKGDRICQGTIHQVLGKNILNFIEVNELNSTDRGESGFGSTGIK